MTVSGEARTYVHDADRDKAIEAVRDISYRGHDTGFGLARIFVKRMEELGWCPAVEAGAPDRETLIALLNRPEHAPMGTHDPLTGACSECPWPLHELGPEAIADAVLAVLPSREAEQSPTRTELLAAHDRQVARIQELDCEVARLRASRETVAPTEEQIARAVGHALVSVRARAVLALFPGEPREAVEARVRRETLLEIARQAEATELPPQSVLDEYLEAQREAVEAKARAEGANAAAEAIIRNRDEKGGSSTWKAAMGVSASLARGVAQRDFGIGDDRGI